jgi:hypothetical protein
MPPRSRTSTRRAASSFTPRLRRLAAPLVEAKVAEHARRMAESETEHVDRLRVAADGVRFQVSLNVFGESDLLWCW